MKARLTRILPLYWLLTCAALIVYLIKPALVNSSGGVTSIFHSFTLLPTHSKYLIRNGWTLSYELYFYAIFSIGLLVRESRKGALAAGILLASLAIGKTFQLSGVYWEFFDNSVLIEFVMGIAIFHLARRFTPSGGLSILLILCSALLLGNVNFNGGSGERALDYGLPCLLFFFAMLGLEQNLTRLENTRAGSLPIKIGDASYSLYLIHPFSLSLVSILFARLGLTTNAPLFIGALAAGALIAGFGCYAWLELPALKLARNYILRKKDSPT